MSPFPVDAGRIGAVSYLNALPLIAGIESLVRVAPPAALAEELHAGKLDVALVPVHEAFVHPGYAAVDGVSIASYGDVFSVAVFTKPVAGDVAGAGVPRRIWLDPDSRTSCMLTKVLFGGPGGSECIEAGAEMSAPQVSPMSVESLGSIRSLSAIRIPAPQEHRRGRPCHVDGVLRIGNPAIQMRIDARPGVRTIDLGGMWKRMTGKPFVYALWLVRSGFTRAAQTAEALRAVAVRGAAERDAIAAAQSWYPPGFASRYLHEHIDHRCEDRHWDGLAEFRDRAVAAGLLPLGTVLPERI